MARYVVSLGGNALGNNAEEQKQLLQNVAKPIVSLIKDGHEVVIVHGNGPQVGMINLAFSNDNVPNMPFPECGAMSQGYIGFHIQNAIKNELAKQHINREATTVITQVLVDKEDPNFLNPTKPVGKFYSKEEALVIAKENGFTMKEDAGRGYRRVVASPLPVDIIEKSSILELVSIGHVVICAGGGGIPVIKEKDNSLVGVAAVIDKDYASAKIATLLDADYLVILTAVDNVYINFRKENEKKLEHISFKKIEQYMQSDHFAKGSMYPKVNACLKFLKDCKDKTAIISSIEKAEKAFKEEAGTIIK